MIDGWSSVRAGLLIDGFYPHRLVGMLNGRHCVDELRYRTQLSQKQLQDVFNAFEEYLIFFHRA